MSDLCCNVNHLRYMLVKYALNQADCLFEMKCFKEIMKKKKTF